MKTNRVSLLWLFSGAMLVLTLGYRVLASTATLAAAPHAPSLTALSASNNGPTVANNATTLTASASGDGDITFLWDFDDDSSGSGITTTHVYTRAGIYTATVVASDATNTLTATTRVYVGDAVVETGDNFYAPKEVTIPLNGTVVWVLRGGTHSVTEDNGRFNQPIGSNWSPFVQTFSDNDTIGYYCILHGAPGNIGMAGRVIVGSGNPADNKIELRLPAIIKGAPPDL